jgi:hypothetical protein
MADPVGTIGLGRPDDDLNLIYRGGENFLARMKSLSDLRASQEEAYLKLRMGEDAKAALQLADQRRAEAERIKEAALEVQAAAEKEAKERLDAAKIVWDESVAKATAEIEKATAAAKQTRKDADAYAKAKRASVDDAITTANLAKENADRLMRECQSKTDAALRAHSEAEEAAKRTTGEAKALKVKLDSHLDKLRRVIAEIER